MSRPKRLLVVVLLLLLVLVSAWATLALGAYQGYSGRHVIVVIPQGAGAHSVAGALHEVGVIRSRAFFSLLLQVSASTAALHAGEYRFEGPLTPMAVRRILVAGDVLLHPVTVPEGLRAAQIFDLFIGRGLGTRAGFERAWRRVEWLQGLDDEAADLEGYLYPDTYHVPRFLPEEEILQGMVKRFVSEFGERERRQARALGLTVRQVITLASMVERETSVPDERSLVSSVFHNRLRRGMLLQCDPTVIYALQRSGQYKGRLTRKGLQFDSPYNTYLYRGLPPGPIANPGLESIHATLHPADSDYLYFVSMNTGRHHFSSNLVEHSRAVRRYQR